MRLPCQRFFRPVSLLSISNVSSFILLPLCVGKPLFMNGSIVPHVQGVRFSLARFVSPPPKLHETGTIQKRCVGKPLFTNGSIVPRAIGVRFRLACFVSPP